MPSEAFRSTMRGLGGCNCCVRVALADAAEISTARINEIRRCFIRVTLLDLSASTCSHSLSLGFRAAGGRDNSIHAEIFDHLAVVVAGMGDAKLGQTQAR